MKKLMVICSVVLLSACSNSRAGGSKLVYPGQTYDGIEWTEEEINKDIAVRNLYRNKNSSTYLMRIQGKEAPHYHDYHDLYGTVMSGKVTIHFEKHSEVLSEGDVLFIPKGTYHWAENSNQNASALFVTFSPAFDGKDRRIVN